MFLPKNDDSKKIFEIIKKVKDIDLEWAIKELQYIEEHEPSISSDILKIYNQCQKKKTIGPKNTFNSYILYALNCTSVRPESFINVPDRRIYARVGFPDIDMDFDHERFNEVEQYAIKKYGEDYFGKIGTHQYISVKLAIRRAIKVLDPGNFSTFDKDGKLLKDGSSESYQLEQLILKTLPEINGQLKKPDGLVCQSVKEAYELFSEFRRYMDQYPEVYRIACRLNGNLNAMGTHAGGRILSPIPLYRICPLHYTNEAGSKNKTPSTQFTMGDVESLGLIKFDFLRIATKSVFRYCKKMISERYGIKIDLSDLPLDDKITLNLINSGKTDGVFQLEEYGMKQAIQMIGINSFEDLSIAIAMYRPGPKDYIPKLAQYKKNPSSIKYIHPIVEKHTKSTYSIIAFQESAMRIFVDLAGLTNIDGYQFIKGAAKKKPELFMAMKERFIKGATKNSSPEIAESVWKSMEPFQGYAFNKSVSFSQKIKTTLKKDHTIQDLYNMHKAGQILPKVFDPNGCEIAIKDVFDHGVLPIFKVSLSDGSEVKCTINHKFLTNSGVKSLKEILDQSLNIIKFRDIKNGKKKRLDLSELQNSYSKQKIVRCSQKRMLSEFWNVKRNTLRRVRNNFNTSKNGYSQKNLFKMERSEISTLLLSKPIQYQSFLEQNLFRQKSASGLQGKNEQDSFRNCDEQREREKTSFRNNEKIKCNSQRHLAKIKSIISKKNISTSRNFSCPNIKFTKMERSKSRRFFPKMYVTVFKTDLVFKARKIFEKHSLPNGIQTLTISSKQNIYKQIAEKTNRLYESKRKNSSRIRWSFPFFEQMGRYKIQSNKRCRSKQGINFQKISNNPNKLRCMVVTPSEIQIYRTRRANKLNTKLQRARCIKNNWEEVPITKCEFIGNEQCYDLEVDSQDHLYCLENNLINSNSHSDAYAYEGIKCAYLKAHYTTEFFCAILMVANLQRDFDFVDKYEKDATRFGIKILNTDINKSKANYSISGDKEIIRPLMIKDVGQKVAEIIEQNQPYNGPDQLLSFAMKVGNEVGLSTVENYCDAGIFNHLKMKKAKILEAFESIKKDKKRAKGRPIGDTYS